jgi:eukaryotic-like serine/threonine-protein kinase
MALAFPLSCPYCGADVSPGAAWCSACSRSLSSRQVASGVLTPPPGSVPDLEDVTDLEDAPTGFAGRLADPDTTGLPPRSFSADGAMTGVGGLARPQETAEPDADASEAVTYVPGQAPSANDETTGPLKIGERFGSRYRITRLLGLGGMGAVYEAWDAELGVSVALKVVRPEIAGDSTAAHDLERRFKRELLLARQVTHKHVVRIHDLGEINGIKYITMPYIEGQDLGTILKTEGRLPIPRALSLARQALSGLVAAHAEGIVHRDLKPANIMVDTNDQALLMDFGIARSIDLPADQITAGPSRTRAGSFGETMVGAVIGTIHYMAPEQAKGQVVDHRADIYAFGLILRDMLVGLDRRKSAPTALAELQRRLDEAPPPLRTVDPGIPESLDRIVMRCLAPNAADRYQTTIDLEADLNRLDENGEPIPIKRVVGLPLVGAVVFLLLALSGGAWWYARSSIPAAPHDPVTVVIADFQNGTGDPTFDHTLELSLKRALEGAGFISAYDRSRIRGTFGVPPPDSMDEEWARQLAVKQGLGVVLAGSIDPRGSGYDLAIRAVQAITGNVVAAVRGRASNKDQVLATATDLASEVREALGDEAPDSAKLLSMKSISTTSLEVASHYASAIEAQSKSQFEEARQSYLKAVELDPKFGAGYQGLANMSANLGQLQDAEKYSREALRFLDAMTERERFAARASFYNMTGDYQLCVKEYGELIARYAADAAAHNQRARCLMRLRNMPGAMDEMQQVVKILPNVAILRANLALVADYAGDFETAEQEVRALEQPDARAISALAFSQLGRGLLREAEKTYQTLGTMGAWGGTVSASGLGDLALYEGRFSDAERIFEQAAVAELASKSVDTAAMKLVLLAYGHLMRGQNSRAAAAAEKALLNSDAVPVRFLAARVLVETGAVDKARTLAGALASELTVERQAYSKILEGEIALKSGDPREAVKMLTEANNLLDTWLGHFALGRAYLELGAFLQADSEFDLCIKRRGEALSLLDEDPTYGHFPAVYYFQGRAREGMKTEGFAASYREYLKIRGQSTEDPLLPEIRRRAGG